MGAETILEAIRAAAAADARLAEHASVIFEALPQAQVQPRTLPAASLIAGCAPPQDANCAALHHAIIESADWLYWQHTYSLDDGLSQAFFDQSGWFNLIAPEGCHAPFTHPAIRVAIGYWGDGLYYPRHRHEPAEIYLVIAGSALFRSEDQGEREVHAGGTVEHRPFEPHSAKMGKEGLIAAAFWRGGGLLDRSEFLPEWPD